MREPKPTVWPLYLITFLTTYAIAVASISAPGIQSALGVADSQLSLVIGSYSATFAAGLIVGGRLGDRVGRRRMFMVGAVGLALTSVLVALAPSLEMLVVARLLQGCTAAMTTPQTLATIQTVLTGSARMRAVSLYAAFAGTGTVGGQVIGGFINFAFGPTWGWRAAFASVAVMAMLAYVGAHYLTETRSPAPLGLDIRGSAILASALMLLIAGLTSAANIDLRSPVEPAAPLLMTGGLLAASLAAFGVLTWHLRAREAAGRDTIMPIAVIRERGVRIGIVLAVLLFVMIGGFLYNYSLLSQVGMGFTPLLSGLSTALLAVAFVAASALAPRFVSALGGPLHGGARLMVIASIIQSVGLVLLAVVLFTGVQPFILWLQIPGLLIGGGQGLMMGPLVSVIMNTVPDRVAGLTGGLVSTAQQTGLGLGIAVLSTLFAAFSGFGSMEAGFAFTVLCTVVLSIAFAAFAKRLTAGGRS